MFSILNCKNWDLLWIQYLNSSLIKFWSFYKYHNRVTTSSYILIKFTYQNANISCCRSGGMSNKNSCRACGNYLVPTSVCNICGEQVAWICGQCGKIDEAIHSRDNQLISYKPEKIALNSPRKQKNIAFYLFTMLVVQIQIIYNRTI